jgi:protoporphyrin/coproporphyrin ferrochelatase
MAKFEPSPEYRDQPPYQQGVLLVNSGTPDSLTTKGVRRFLRRLLRDRRTIEVSRAIWCWLLYFAILPMRPKFVLPKYRRVWTERGSPLLVHSEALRAALQAQLSKTKGTTVPVELGMLYSTPDVAQGLAKLRAAGAQEIFVLPLFPQYSGTTNAAAYDQVGKALRSWRYVPALHLLPDYAVNEKFIDGVAAAVRDHWQQHGKADHLLITFHGIPLSYVQAGDPYQRKCEATARALVQRLGIPAADWSLSFQSRVGRAEWLGPYTDTVVKQLAQRGVKTLDAVCPGFAVDCLETIDEIGHECAETFRAAGGGELRYIPALNSSAAHIDLLASLLGKAN